MQATARTRLRIALAEDPFLLRTLGYVAALVVTASGLVFALIKGGHAIGPAWVVAVLAVAAAFAERGSVQLERGIPMESSISNLPLLFAAVVLGPLPAMVVGASSVVGAFGWSRLRRLSQSLMRALTGAIAGLTATAVLGSISNNVGDIAIGTAVAGLAVESIDFGFLCLTALLRGKKLRPVAQVLLPVTLLSIPLYAPLVALLAVAYLEVSPWTLPLFLVPALAFQKLYALYQDQRRLAADLGFANDRLEKANISFATALVATLDARDRYTAGHSAAVAVYARDIAARLGLSEDEQQLAHLCGLVHDIGKIGLPAGLLEKPGALTLEERKQMQEHSEIGERILAKVEDYAEIARIVRHHHERMDGMGYPDGIVGEAIPLLARIICVADAYNAMTSDRPYRDAMPSRVARMRLAQGVEGQFDTAIVAAFEAILALHTEDYRTARGAEFTLTAQDHYSSGLQASEEAA
jgi:putative nucleotidyltransferase with HDIG domain